MVVLGASEAKKTLMRTVTDQERNGHVHLGGEMTT